LLVPLVRAKGRHVLGDATINRQEQSKNKLGHGDGIFPGTIADEDTPGTSGFDVDGIDSSASAKNKGQLVRGVDGFCCDLFAAYQEDLVRRNAAGKIAGLDGRIGSDLAAQRSQAAYLGFGELVGDKGFHFPFSDRTELSQACVQSRAKV